MPMTVIPFQTFLSVEMIRSRRTRHATQKHVLFKCVYPVTHTGKNDVNGPSVIYISVARSSTIRIKRARHQAVQSTKDCRRYCRWKWRKRKRGIEYATKRTNKRKAIPTEISLEQPNRLRKRLNRRNEQTCYGSIKKYCEDTPELRHIPLFREELFVVHLNEARNSDCDWTYIYL